MAAEFSMSLRVLKKERLATGGSRAMSGALASSACLRLCCKSPSHFQGIQLRSVPCSPEGDGIGQISTIEKQGSVPTSRMSRHSTEDVRVGWKRSSFPHEGYASRNISLEEACRIEA